MTRSADMSRLATAPTVAGPVQGTRITEHYARLVARDTCFWAWTLSNVYNRRQERLRRTERNGERRASRPHPTRRVADPRPQAGDLDDLYGQGSGYEVSAHPPAPPAGRCAQRA